MRAKKTKREQPPQDPLELFHPTVRRWFQDVFPAPTRPQSLGWPAIAGGRSTLILAPTGSGKTLAAFLWCIDRLLFTPPPPPQRRCRILYISPIKALAVDVERNLRAPLAGIAQAALREGTETHLPSIAIRTGDTPARDRSRFLRQPADILITTPESLYLMLTSNARDTLRAVETVVVDEIHALAPTKRGSHLAVSLERLERLCGRPLQRIGLSATQRPLEETARFLGGALDRPGDASEPLYRPVEVVDASEPKRLEIRVQAPVEDMARIGALDDLPSGPAAQGPVRTSIWSAIHPQLLDLVRAHRSTLIFANSRRLAERISGALNELAGETLVRAHHGSVAAEQRREIEDRLKMGLLRGLVATSSLELGIDMGAIDLVVQIEAPPSVASGLQRIGRSGHQVGGTSAAVVFPKYRGDLLACAAASAAMREGAVEAVRFPRNPLDVLAQQVVAMTAMEEWNEAELFALLRRAAPYAELTRPVWEGVLDMLSGRYPSEEFYELRPRISWDRVRGRLAAREGARLLAVVNGGTIPDRGLYGVYLTGGGRGARVGELDEEMVFESRVGETIALGATTWRIEEITHDRVSVSPAPGEPGKMPFWRGDAPGRPAEFGRRIGELARDLLAAPRAAAHARLVERHGLDEAAAENLLRYLDDQKAAAGCVPSDRDILVERCRDELGDWRICVLTPFGARVHAPWCMAAAARLRALRGLEAESMWTDDGFVLRLPESEEPIDTEWVLPPSAELRELVTRQLGSTSLFAGRFREAAARALLLPRRRAGARAPLWSQRKRSADLLAAASRYPAFPILLEAYRECLRDMLDLEDAADTLRAIERGAVRVSTVDSRTPSPFAASLLFGYVANYIYDGDAPLAERRLHALAIDQSRLEQILGVSDLRELLDRAALEEVEERLQALAPDQRARHPDALHDLLLRLGDLTPQEIAARCQGPAVEWTRRLAAERRAVALRIAGETRYVPVEYAARYRDALGAPLPPGLAAAFLEPSERPLHDLLRRYARVHGPFTAAEAARRFGLAGHAVEAALAALHAAGRLLEGEFRPGGSHREWCDPDVLQQVRRRTLARLRKEVEPAARQSFARMLVRWQGAASPRRGLDALVDAIETLQGAALIASEIESEILPARVAAYQPADLDALLASGEVVWVGRERLGERDGRVAFYLADNLPLLLEPEELRADSAVPLSERALLVLEALAAHGAQFFTPLHQAAGGGFPGDTVDALWELVWAGRATNDTFHPVRRLSRPREERKVHGAIRDAAPGSPEFLRRLRGRERAGGPQGRWSLVVRRQAGASGATEWSAALARQLLVRHGVAMRETALAEGLPGGYGAVYPAFKTMEEGGWIRRGMFVAGLGAAQFALPAAVDMLRGLPADPDPPEAVYLAASDPANPYGAALEWPSEEKPHSMARAAGAGVVLVNGALAAFLRRGNPSIRVLLPEGEPERSRTARALARTLAALAARRQSRRGGLLIAEIEGLPAREHPMARFLEEAGFVSTSFGFQMRRAAAGSPSLFEGDEAEEVSGSA